jgi:GAF domain-containing protein
MDTGPGVQLADALESDAEVAVATAEWFSHAARELQEANGLHETMQQILELATKLVDADLAVLIGVPRAAALPELLAATDYAAGQELIALQRAAGAAPVWQAILDRAPVQVDDLATDERWTKFAPLLLPALGFRSILAFCLLIGDQPLAALGIYARPPNAFSSDQIGLASAFAEHAAIAFDHAAQTEHVSDLEIALEHSRDIGAAVGILMERLSLSQREAFAHLRKASQDHNHKLYDLARQLLSTGRLPPY